MNEPQPDHILQVGMGFLASKTLLSAIEMELFTELADRSEPLEMLQGRLGLHPRAARDFLDALVALKFLERSNGNYSNTPSTAFFLDKRKPSYIGGILEMANHRLYPFWGHLTTALRTGAPQNESKDGGPDPFVALYADPARLKQFLGAMTGVSRGANMAIARLFPWQQYRTAVDVGTAQGDLITQVALANHAYRRNRIRSCSGWSYFRRVCRGQRAVQPGEVCSRELLRAAFAKSGRGHDGPYPA